jgi:hypothetical protein
MVEPISAQLNAPNLAALRRGLEELGYVEGRNFVFDYRSADGNAALYPGLVAEVIGRNPELIIARGTPAALAVKRATSTIPVVMIVGEPLLVVDSLARPGGNITGLSGDCQAQDRRKRGDHLHRVAEAELAQVGDFAADVAYRVAEDRRERFDQFHWVSKAEFAKVGYLLADTSDRVAEDRRARLEYLHGVGEAELAQVGDPAAGCC